MDMGCGGVLSSKGRGVHVVALEIGAVVEDATVAAARHCVPPTSAGCGGDGAVAMAGPVLHDEVTAVVVYTEAVPPIGSRHEADSGLLPYMVYSEAPPQNSTQAGERELRGGGRELRGGREGENSFVLALYDNSKKTNIDELGFGCGACAPGQRSKDGARGESPGDHSRVSPAAVEILPPSNEQAQGGAKRCWEGSVRFRPRAA